MKRFILLILLAAIAFAAVSQDAEAAKKRRAKAAQPDRYAAIVIEATTGTVISETSPDRRLYPASLTKMMTLYMTFEAIDQGRMRKNDRISVSSRASMQEPSKLGLAPGSTIRVEDAILGLVTKSANDASVVLAEAMGGTEGRFATMMTAKARQLGMRNTNFINASGLHNPNQYSTARDMALLGQALIRDYPREYKYFSTNRFTYAGAVHGNHNRLMNTYDGMDGIKTGYVYASGYNLTASAVRNGQRLIGVVFGGQTTVSRNQQMAKLLDAGFANLRDPRVANMISRNRAQMAAGLAPTENVGTTATSSAAAQARVVSSVTQNRVAANNNTATPNASSVIRAAEQKIAQQQTQRKPTPKPGDVPAFNAIGLVTEQGDSGEGFDTAAKPVVAAAKPAAKAAPQQMASAATLPAGNLWTVQVGAYASHDASLAALKQVKQKLPANLTTHTQYLIAPLMTNRGMIYRARLSGLDRDGAATACRILQGSCLVMAAQ